MAIAQLETQTESKELEAAQLGRFLNNHITDIIRLEEMQDMAIKASDERARQAYFKNVDESELALASFIANDKKRYFISQAHALSKSISEKAGGNKIILFSGEELSTELGILSYDREDKRTIFGDWPLTNDQIDNGWREATMDEWNYLFIMLHTAARRYPDPQGQLFPLL